MVPFFNICYDNTIIKFQNRDIYNNILNIIILLQQCLTGLKQYFHLSLLFFNKNLILFINSFGLLAKSETGIEILHTPSPAHIYGHPIISIPTRWDTCYRRWARTDVITPVIVHLRFHSWSCKFCGCAQVWSDSQPSSQQHTVFPLP